MGFLVSDSWTLLLQGFSSTDWHAPLHHQSTYAPLSYTSNLHLPDPSYHKQPSLSYPFSTRLLFSLSWLNSVPATPGVLWQVTFGLLSFPCFSVSPAEASLLLWHNSAVTQALLSVLSQGFKQFRKFNIKRILHWRRAFFLSLFVHWKLSSCAVAKVVVRMAYLGCFWYTIAQVLHFTCMIQPCHKHHINALGYMLAYKRELQASYMLGKHSTFEIFFQIWYVCIP